MRQGDAGGAGRDPKGDVELEVSSLDAPQVEALAPVSGAKDASGSDGTEAAGTEPDEGPTLPSRMTGRRRTVAAASSAAAVILALLVVFSTSSHGVPVLPAFFPTPTLTPTLAPGADSVALVHPVPWGVLTLDGRKVDGTQAAGPTSALYLTLGAARRTHTLDYAAAPFPELRCQLSVPPAASDTCPAASSNLSRAIVDTYAFPRVLDLQATPDHLPPAQYQALLQEIQNLLVFAPGDVAAGDHYAAEDGTTVSATRDFQATLRATLDTDRTTSGAFNMNGESCVTLCPVGAAFNPGVGQTDWGLLAVVRAAWQFTDKEGHIVGTTPIDAAGQDAQSGVPPLVQVAVGWNGAWSATMVGDQFVFGGLCEFGIDRFVSLLDQPGANDGMSFGASGGHSLADGCLVSAMRASSAPADPQTPSVPVVLGSALYRYGALLAADDGGHRLLPQLPLPSAHERTIITALAHPSH